MSLGSSEPTGTLVTDLCLEGIWGAARSGWGFLNDGARGRTSSECRGRLPGKKLRMNLLHRDDCCAVCRAPPAPASVGLHCSLGQRALV